MRETQKDRDHVPMKCTMGPVEITRRWLNQQSQCWVWAS